jgi:hypothetical protein
LEAKKNNKKTAKQNKDEIKRLKRDSLRRGVWGPPVGTGQSPGGGFRGATPTPNGKRYNLEIIGIRDNK